MHFVHFGSREAMRDPRLRLIARRDPGGYTRGRVSTCGFADPVE